MSSGARTEWREVNIAERPGGGRYSPRERERASFASVVHCWAAVGVGVAIVEVVVEGGRDGKREDEASAVASLAATV